MKFTRIACAAAIVAAAPFVATAQDWRGWNIHPEGYPNSVALDQFVETVNAETDLNLQVFHGGVLGSQPDAIEQVRNNALEFGQFNMGPMGPIIPTTNVLSLPFIFSSVDHMHKAMDGDVGEIFAEAMEAEGLVPLAWYDSGSRSFYNSKRPIVTPADVEGLKLRVMNNDLFVDMVAQLGGNATPMAFGEVYQSLKTGVIDGAENNYPSYESTGHFEVAGFYSITDHLIIPECLCVSTESWNALDDDTKAKVMAAARASAVTQRELWAAREQESLDKVRAAGAQVNEVENKVAFQERMAPVYESFLAANPDLGVVIEAIQAVN
ncbi:TRAP transporter substrate-binding protein [Jannaschia pohangensis]|uniref:Tripartite ATP-independent transporter solute receptor, DctP family n=1 Tax=Jannaschia pohangensis TaxID=390807 RepID=A0A1I3HGY9_9RHOB|nr:TRAP transporter substrate-binding protein [Jannaschia pohangensis]SFI34942.1 tripartite ATP-independent transporter solute receptor, DctP family [Jannaschia pohangensis]